MSDRNTVSLSLLDSEVNEIIDCLKSAADQAEEWAQELATTPKAQELARGRACRMYALMASLERAKLNGVRSAGAQSSDLRSAPDSYPVTLCREPRPQNRYRSFFNSPRRDDLPPRILRLAYEGLNDAKKWGYNGRFRNHPR